MNNKCKIEFKCIFSYIVTDERYPDYMAYGGDGMGMGGGSGSGGGGGGSYRPYGKCLKTKRYIALNFKFILNAHSIHHFEFKVATH